jgi:hypothetical protein
MKNPQLKFELMRTVSLFSKYFQEIVNGKQTTNNRQSATASSLAAI